MFHQIQTNNFCLVKITKSLYQYYTSTITQHGSSSTVNCEMLTQDVKNNGKPLILIILKMIVPMKSF